LAGKNSRSNGSSKKPAADRPSSFAVCIRNEGYPGSLELRKLYRVLSDASAQKHGYIRVIDESGEDYLYPRRFFVAIRLSPATEKALLVAS
jgi:hypothetical protein